MRKSVGRARRPRTRARKNAASPARSLSYRNCLREEVLVEVRRKNAKMFHVVICLSLLNIATATSTDNVAKQNISIKLGFIGPLHDSLGATATLGKELASAFKIAIELINDKALSDGSKIRLSTDYKTMIKDGGLTPKTTCKIAAQQLAADSDVVGVIGGFRSQCSIASHLYFRSNAEKMTQISYGSTSAELSNKKQFPRFFRTCASDVNQAIALADLVTHFNWRRISTIATMDDHKKGLAEKFEYEAKLKGIRIFASSRFPSGANSDIVEQKVQMLKDAQTRINIVTALPQDGLKIFQQAKEKGMTRKGWVWLGSDSVMATPLTDQDDVNKAMEGTVGIMPRGGSGSIYLKIIVQWLSKTDKKKYPGIIHHGQPETSAYVAQVYDAVYAYYLAFDKLAQQGKISAADSPSTLRKIVFDQLKQFNSPTSGFQGAEGMYTYFDQNFDGPPVYDIGNIQGGRWVKVGTWNKTLGVEQNENSNIVWPGNIKVPPTDNGLPGKTTFRIGFIGPMYPDLAGLSQLGKEFESAFRVAVEMMNKDRSLSVDFDVRLQDGGVDPEKSCKAAAEDLVEDDVVAVIGAYRSSCSAAAAKVLGSDKNQVPQVSYGSTSPSLSDKTKYKYLYRTCASDVHQASALAALFKKYRWPEVGTIATDDTYGSGLMEEFNRKVKNMSNVPVTVATKQEFPVNARAAAVRPKVQKLKDAGSKVNLIGMFRQNAETVFQQIKELGMTGKDWIWLGSDGATTSTFEGQRELERAMQGMVGTQPKNGEGSLYLKFLAAWLKKDSTTYPGIVHSRPTRPSSAAFTAQLLDAVHGVALALSDLVNKKDISRSTHVQTVRQKLHEKLMTYDSKSTGFRSAMGNSHLMYFDQNQDGPPLYDIVNLVDNNWVTVGQYNSEKNDITLRKDPVFPGGTTIPEVGADRPTYKIAAFFPKHESLDALASLGSEWESAFRMAVELVNKDPTFKVAFNYVNVDGGPSAESCRKAAENLPENVDLIIGEARSSCSIAIAKATKDLGIPQMSYASTSTQLSDKQTFPNFFRTCARDEYQGMALAKLVQRSQWCKVGTITTTDAYAEELSRKFALEVRRMGVDISSSQEFEMHSKGSIAEEVRALKSEGSCVNLVSGATDDAEKVFQEAIEQGMTGKGWTWLGTDGATSSTFTKSPNLRTAMQGMVGTRPKSGHGQLYRKLLKAWSEKDAEAFPGLVHYSRVQKASVYVAQVYDAVLAYAHALTRLYEAGTISKTSSRRTMQQLLMAELKKMKDPSTGFTGATGGQQFFDTRQDGPPVYDVVNLNGESWTQVGTYSPEEGLSLKRKIVWAGGSLSTPSCQQPGQVEADPREVATSSESSDHGGVVALGVVFGVFATVMMAFIGFLIYRERTGNPSFGPRVFSRGHPSPVNQITDVMNNGVYRTEVEKANPEFV